MGRCGTCTSGTSNCRRRSWTRCVRARAAKMPRVLPCSPSKPPIVAEMCTTRTSAYGDVRLALPAGYDSFTIEYGQACPSDWDSRVAVLVDGAEVDAVEASCDGTPSGRCTLAPPPAALHYKNLSGYPLSSSGYSSL